METAFAVKLQALSKAPFQEALASMQKGQLVLLGKSGTDLFEQVASELKHDTSGLLHMAAVTGRH